VLARLLEIEGLQSVETDRAGMVLRISCGPERTEECVSAVQASLAEAGYRTHLLEGPARQTALDAVSRWYDLDSVDALSQEELATLKEQYRPEG